MFFSTNKETFLTELQQIIPASMSTSRERLWPFIEQAERMYVLPLLETEFYDDLQTFYNDRDKWQSGSGDDIAKTSALIKLLQIAEVNLAYLIGFDLLSVIISDLGFQRPGESDGGGVKGLYKYQEVKLQEYFERTGFNGLDDALKYLEANIEHFPEWEDSTNYTLRKTAIIKDAESFDKICYINKSRLTFLRLQRFMNEVIDIDIKPVLGAEFVTLMAELAKEDPAAKYIALVPEIQKPLAYLSCAKLIEKTGNLTDRGLFFEGKNSLYPDDTTKKPAEGDAAMIAANSYRETGIEYLTALVKYLTDNAFISSGSKAGNPYTRDNTDKKTFVA